MEFLNKTLKEIFSENICTKYKFYKSDYNKKIINDLLKEKNEDIRKQFEKLFSLTFMECLFHFRGEKYKDELEGLENLDYICNQFDDIDYVELFRYHVLNYEKIIMKKSSRKRLNK